MGKGTQTKACLAVPGGELLQNDGNVMGYREKGHLELHQKAYSALFLKDGCGRGRERGRCSLADNKEEPEGHPWGSLHWDK